ncbi:MAG: hypothetical protein ABI356_02870 [Steroidobacteraceae bacterium]
MYEPPQRAGTRLLRLTIFALIAALHVAILLIASRWQTHLDLRIEESLVFLPLPAHVQSAEKAPPQPSSPRKKPEPAHDTQLVAVPTPAAPAPTEQRPATVDWSAEAALTAKQRAQSALAPQPRALDKHAAGANFDAGLGPDQTPAPEFGWDHAHTHRVEAMEGGGSILWINDRCFIVMYGMIPFPMCGIGEIPVRGDLFDHMRDPKTREPNVNNTAP